MIVHRSQSVGHRRHRTVVLGHIIAWVLLLGRYKFTVCPSHPHWESHTSTLHLMFWFRLLNSDWALSVESRLETRAHMCQHCKASPFQSHTAALLCFPTGSFLLVYKHVFPDQKNVMKSERRTSVDGTRWGWINWNVVKVLSSKTKSQKVLGRLWREPGCSLTRPPLCICIEMSQILYITYYLLQNNLFFPSHFCSVATVFSFIFNRSISIPLSLTSV